MREMRACTSLSDRVRTTSIAQHKSAGVFEYFSLNPVVLNTETHQWFEPRTALGKGPVNRAYHTTTRVGSALFIFGGSCKALQKGGKPGLLGDMPVFDLVQMAWETRDVRGRKPSARSMHSAALSEGKLFVFGGFDGSQVFSHVSHPLVLFTRPHPTRPKQKIAARSVLPPDCMHPPLQSLGDVSVLDTESFVWSHPTCDGSVRAPNSTHTTQPMPFPSQHNRLPVCLQPPALCIPPAR